MIWFLLYVLTLFATPGDNVTITINETSLLETSDPCLYFVETLKNSAYLTPGSHMLRVGAGCAPGVKFLTANNVTIAEIRVSSELKMEKLRDYALWLEQELMKINNKLESLGEELRNVIQKLNETKSEKERIEKDKKTLELQLMELNESYSSLKSKYDLLTSKYELLTSEIENKTTKIAQMEIEIKGLTEQSANYRMATLFLISLFVGSFAAIIMMIRRF